MAEIKNTISGPIANGVYNRSTSHFRAIAYGSGGFITGNGGPSFSAKEYRGKITQIELAFDRTGGSFTTVKLRKPETGQTAGSETLISTANMQLVSGNRYKANFTGYNIETYLNSKIEQDPGKNPDFLFYPTDYSSSNTMSNGHLTITYDFRYPIVKDLIQPDPNAGPVIVKIKYEGLDDTNDNPSHDSNKTYYESSLTFAGHAPIIKNGDGRLIEYAPGDIKAKTGSFSVKLYKKTRNADLGQDIFAPIGELNEEILFNPTPPIVHGLEPDGIDVNIQTPQVISWHSDKQTKFTLKINDTQYTGTNERSLAVPANTLIKGVNRLHLEVWNGIGSTVVTATFRGYGKPTLPIFDNKNIYNAASPKIKWTTDEQHIYQFQIFNGIEKIYDTGEVISSAQEHQVTQILENKTTYTVKVKVKNDKGLWSDLAQKDIEISYVALEPATLTLFETNSQIVVNVSNPGNRAFAKCEVYRKTAYTPWRRIAKNAPIQTSFADNLIASNTEYSYKVISYDKQGGATESDIKTAKIKLKTEQFINLDGMEILPRVYTTKDTGFTLQKVQDKTIMKFEGMTAPMIESGEKDYSVLKCSAAFLNFEDYKQFKYIADNAQVIMFRSALGHLIYGQVTSWGDESAISTGRVTINFIFTEVNFIESEIYDGGMTLRTIRLDAGYKLDAGYELDGYYNE